MNLYYIKSTGERVKILEVVTCGITKVVNKQKETFFVFIGELSKVY